MRNQLPVLEKIDLIPNPCPFNIFQIKIRPQTNRAAIMLKVIRKLPLALDRQTGDLSATANQQQRQKQYPDK
jgi:hypothetical protein